MKPARTSTIFALLAAFVLGVATAQASSPVIKIVTPAGAIFPTFDDVIFDNGLKVRDGTHVTALPSGTLVLPGNTGEIPFGQDGLKPNQARFRGHVATIGVGTVTLDDGQTFSKDDLGKQLFQPTSVSLARTVGTPPPNPILLVTGQAPTVRGVLPLGANVFAVAAAAPPGTIALAGYSSQSDARQNCAGDDVVWVTPGAMAVSALGTMMKTQAAGPLPGGFACAKSALRPELHLLDLRSRKAST